MPKGDFNDGDNGAKVLIGVLLFAVVLLAFRMYHYAQ